jgi:predicted HAD superfamily Cof-like phosphohydrolase
MLTNFQKVKEFMISFEQKTYDLPQSDLLKDDKLYFFRFNLISEEFDEIKKAINDDNFVEFVDGIADLLFVTYGTCLSYGINIDNHIKNILINEEIDNINSNYEIIYKIISKRNKSIIIPTNPQIKLLNGNRKIVDNYIKLIGNSINYLKFKNKIMNDNQSKYFNYDISLNNMTNALFNIIYDTYSMGIIFGINVDEAFDIVHKSNMTKLCLSEEEAKKTVEWYIQNELRYLTPSYKKAPDDIHWIVYEQSTGKVLKSINYTPANLIKFSK